MSIRTNPFEDLSDFEPKLVPKPVPIAAIEQIAEESGFPSRKVANKPTSVHEATPVAIEVPRAVRRYTTGRNRQINIKATTETIERLYRLADKRGIPLGALLEEALNALENTRKCD